MRTTIMMLLMIAASVGMHSCLSGERKAYIDRIDSLLVQVDSAWNEYQQLDTTAVLRAFDHFKVVIDSFNLYFDDNREDTSFAVIARFSQAKGPFKHVSKEYPGVGADLQSCGMQLRNLREDVRKRKWKDQEIEGHIASEESAFMKANSNLSDLKENMRIGVQMYESELPHMRNVIKALMKKRGMDIDSSSPSS